MKQRIITALIGTAAVTLCGAIPRQVAAAPHQTATAPAAATALTPAEKKQLRIAAYIDSLPHYVSMDTLNHIRALRGGSPPPYLEPFMDGKALPPSVQSLPGANPVLVADSSQFDGIPTLPDSGRSASASNKRILLAQAPEAIPPAAVPGGGGGTAAEMPHWVRYPLEFQLCGIALGTHAVDKDQNNRIDRYGLFAMHGNPTAVVVPATGGGGVTVSQEPPEVASLFDSGQNGFLPDWASAITVQLDNNHVEWLYKRTTYAMGFVVDRLGFVDAIVVAGTYSPIARTQMEDRYHSVQLGDDTRKVLYRYGYPDTVETYEVTPTAGVSTQTGGGGGGGAAAGGAGGGAGGAGLPGGGGPPGGGAAAPAAGGAGAGGAQAVSGPSNGAYRTFEFRYEQSYNVVFSIRDNRVVRIYIFGDPDFFNMARRQQLRDSY